MYCLFKMYFFLVCFCLLVVFNIHVVDSVDICKDSVGDNMDWPFDNSIGSSYSCISSGSGTNDLGNAPTMCEGDPASVKITVQKGKAECLVAKAFNCKIPMHDFKSLDYDFAVDSCMGIWAAPLWLTPDTWQWGAGSGEIDSLEFCARDAIHMNYAGGGHQVEVNATDFSINNSTGHVTVRKDSKGIMTITTCTKEAASKNGNQCVAPTYTSCDDCLRSTNDYACWCNDPDNIYGSGGCVEGTDCLWTLVSDIWNGVGGDDGYTGCMTAVPSIGLNAGQPNLNSHCSISVQQIVVRGGGVNGSIQWGKGSNSNCKVITT